MVRTTTGGEGGQQRDTREQDTSMDAALRSIDLDDKTYASVVQFAGQHHMEPAEAIRRIVENALGSQVRTEVAHHSGNEPGGASDPFARTSDSGPLAPADIAPATADEETPDEAADRRKGGSRLASDAVTGATDGGSAKADATPADVKTDKTTKARK
jgi:hypothetical protein